MFSFIIWQACTLGSRQNSTVARKFRWKKEKIYISKRRLPAPTFKRKYSPGRRVHTRSLARASSSGFLVGVCFPPPPAAVSCILLLPAVFLARRRTIWLKAPRRSPPRLMSRERKKKNQICLRARCVCFFHTFFFFSWNFCNVGTNSHSPLLHSLVVVVVFRSAAHLKGDADSLLLPRKCLEL